MVDTSEERIYGATLEQEERIRAREAELERISAQERRWGRKKVGRSGREISQRSGALSGVQSSKAGGERGPVGRPGARRSSCRTNSGAVGSGEQAVDAAGREAGWLVASSDWPAVG